VCACEVVTSRPLDRERTPFYSLKVRCQDAGDEPRLTETTIQVNVVDVNDNSPVFTAQTYRGTLVENNYIGASVLQASAPTFLRNGFRFAALLRRDSAVRCGAGCRAARRRSLSQRTRCHLHCIALRRQMVKCGDASLQFRVSRVRV